MTKETKELIDSLRWKFYNNIQKKNSWGKNELMTEYERSVTEALMDLITKQT